MNLSGHSQGEGGRSLSSQKTSAVATSETASFFISGLRGDPGAIYRASNAPVCAGLSFAENGEEESNSSLCRS
jgi:hypothetical protein